MQCVALTDNQGLFSNNHHLKSNVEDYRLQSDILELRKSIEQEKTVLNIADALTKTTKTGAMLLQLVQTGHYDLPGGTFVRDSTMTSVRTWNELI